MDYFNKLLFGQETDKLIVLDKKLNNACKIGDLNKIKELYESGADLSNLSYLHKAIKNGHLNIVKYLFNNFDLKFHDYALVNASNTHLELVQFIFENSIIKIKVANIACSNAVSKGKTRIVQYLHKKGANLFKMKFIDVFTASRDMHFEVLYYLLQNDVNVYLHIFENRKFTLMNYCKQKDMFNECMKRIHFHPGLERTRTENLDKLHEYNLNLLDFN